MTFEDILKQCANGKMPEVLYRGKRCQVVVIKNAEGFCGIGVNTGRDYIEWFHESSEKDARKKYIRDLSSVSSL